MDNLFGPYGFILALVCICVVFSVLFALYLCYALIGKIFVSRYARKDVPTGNMDKMEENPSDAQDHDVESGVITINRSSQPYGELPSPVIIPLNVKLGHAKAHSEEYLINPYVVTNQHTLGSGTVVCPLPGVIIGISVKVGEQVVPGQRVATLEAMKMENAIEAEKAGTVKEIHVNVGDSVLEGAKIVTIV